MSVCVCVEVMHVGKGRRAEGREGEQRGGEERGGGGTHLGVLAVREGLMATREPFLSVRVKADHLQRDTNNNWSTLVRIDSVQGRVRCVMQWSVHPAPADTGPPHRHCRHWPTTQTLQTLAHHTDTAQLANNWYNVYMSQ